MGHSFTMPPEGLADVRQDLGRLAGSALARSQTLETEDQDLPRLNFWANDRNIGGSGPSQEERTRLWQADPCADLLREQIAMVVATLAPRGALDRQIAQAEQHLRQLKMERKNAVRTVASLRDALEQVTRNDKAWLEEQPRQQNQRLEQE